MEEEGVKEYAELDRLLDYYDFKHGRENFDEDCIVAKLWNIEHQWYSPVLLPQSQRWHWWYRIPCREDRK